MNSIKVNNFDLLRLIAAIQVVFLHIYDHILLPSNFENSYIAFIFNIINKFPGVPIFFLISGFLISLSYEKNSSLKDYATNRILRIYPALYLNIFISILILYFLGYMTFNKEFFIWLFAQLTLFQFYNIEMFRDFGVGVPNGSLWTVSIELTFYIFVPILYFFYRKSRLWLLLFLVISFSLWLYDLGSEREMIYDKLLHISILPYLFIFILGAIFFKFFNILEKYIVNKFFIWFVLFLTLKIIFHIIELKMNVFFYIFEWIVFAFMIFSFAFSFRSLSNKLLKGNDFTYGIYIYHMLLVNLFIHFSLVGEFKYFLYILFMSFVIGIISWFFVEKPFLKLKKHSLFREIHSGKTQPHI